MSGARNTLSFDEVLNALNENYAIPGDGEQSDIDSEFADSDTEITDVVDMAVGDEDAGNLDDLHAIDVVELEDNNTAQSQGGRLSRFDFSSTEWSCQKSEAVPQGAFRQEVGPVTTLPREATALDFFHLLFTMNIVRTIVHETNRYAQQCLHPDFENVTEAEILAYLGLLIAMSLHPLHCRKDYWSSDWVLGVPALARVMSRNRFQSITRFLHLNDNSTMPARGTPGFDKLYKVKPFQESIAANFLSQYRPHKQASVDEAMIKFKGRTSLKQYMPKKPVKRGINMWCRADSWLVAICVNLIFTLEKLIKEYSTTLDLLWSPTCANRYLENGMRSILITFSPAWNLCRHYFPTRLFLVGHSSQEERISPKKCLTRRPTTSWKGDSQSSGSKVPSLR